MDEDFHHQLELEIQQEIEEEDQLQRQYQIIEQELLEIQILEEREVELAFQREHQEYEEYQTSQEKDYELRRQQIDRKKLYYQKQLQKTKLQIDGKFDYNHFKDQTTYSIFDHIPSLKWYKHDLSGKSNKSKNQQKKVLDENGIKSGSVGTRSNFNLQILTFSISKSILLIGIKAGFTTLNFLGVILKAPFTVGFSIKKHQQKKADQQKLEKQHYELVNKKYPTLKLNKIIHQALHNEFNLSAKALTEKLIFQILVKYHEGISNHSIADELKITEYELNLVMDLFYSELSKDTRDDDKGQNINATQDRNSKDPETINQVTSDESENIIDLWLQGKSPKEIARILGLPISVVEGFVTVLNLPQTVKKQPVQQTVSKPWTKKDVDYLVQNYDKMTPHKIGMNLGRTRKAVIGKKNKLKQKKRDLDAKQNSKKLNMDLNSKVVYINKMQKKIVRMHIQELRGLRNIGSKIKKDARTWQYLIHELGIDILSPGSLWKKVKEHFEGKYDVHLTEQMNDIIIGTLLGDGNLRIQTKTRPHPNQPLLKEYKQILTKVSAIQETLKITGNLTYKDIKYWNYAINKFKDLNTATFRIHKSIFEREWVKMLFDEFTKFQPATPYIKKIIDVEDPESFKWSCGFDTQATFQLLKIWQNWYVLKGDEYKKIIPHNLTQLTPNILLHWYIGDGSYSGGSIHLYTFGFSYDDHLRIQQMLLDIGINSTIKDRVDDDWVKTHFIFISSKKSNREILFDYLSQAKFFAKANELFPHKFTKEIEYTETLNETKFNNPEYFTYDKKLDWKYYYDSK